MEAVDAIKRITAHPAIWLAGLAVLFLLALSSGKETQTASLRPWTVIGQKALQGWTKELQREYLPLLSYSEWPADTSVWERLARRELYALQPLYALAPSRPGASEGEAVHYLGLADMGGTYEEQGTEYSAQESGMGQSPAGMHTVDLDGDVADDKPQTVVSYEGDFVLHNRVNPIDLSAWSEYETLVKECYAIDPNTMAGSDQLDVNRLYGKDLTLDTEGEGPQILIYHTHSQEAFADSVPGDPSTGIVGVGEELARILSEEYGYRVLHHTGEYDVASRDEAYSKALPAIEQLLAENPSIQIVIDLHRDEMAEQTRLVTNLDGRPTARFMFFNGLSRTRKTGNIDYLYNPNLEDNLAFSFQLQLAAMEYYPGLTRKIYLKGYRYNMHLRPRDTLIELGAQNNTVEEAMNACEPLAHILHLVLSGELKNQQGE